MKVTVDGVLTVVIIIIGLIEFALGCSVALPIKRRIELLGDKIWKEGSSEFFEYDVARYDRLEKRLSIVRNIMAIGFALMFIIGVASLIYQSLI